MKIASRIIISNGQKENKKVLLGKRAEGNEVGKWGVIGGRLKPPDENAQVAALRELAEEADIIAEEVHYLITNTAWGWINFFYLVTISEDTPVNPDQEHSELQWFTEAQLDELQDQIAFNNYQILKHYFVMDRE